VVVSLVVMECCNCMIRGYYDDGSYYEDEDEEGRERIFINLNNYTEDEIEIQKLRAEFAMRYILMKTK